mmetsp:Transcript_21756/g.70280  ORF Transcript_21756/g.70280 Transcript_21756/m.70280 type:complete len:253 (-) Transcript_21756:782-1540(-)
MMMKSCLACAVCLFGCAGAVRIVGLAPPPTGLPALEEQFIANMTQFLVVNGMVSTGSIQSTELYLDVTNQRWRTEILTPSSITNVTTICDMAAGYKWQLTTVSPSGEIECHRASVSGAVPPLAVDAGAFDAGRTTLPWTSAASELWVSERPAKPYFRPEHMEWVVAQSSPRPRVPLYQTNCTVAYTDGCPVPGYGKACTTSGVRLYDRFRAGPPPEWMFAPPPPGVVCKPVQELPPRANAIPAELFGSGSGW